jgi:hypothetical protein
VGPQPLLPEWLAILEAGDFKYKPNLVWHKARKDGHSAGRGIFSWDESDAELGAALRLVKPRSRGIEPRNPARSAVLDDEAGGTARADIYGNFAPDFE